MVLVESRHLRIKIKKHILQRLFPNRRHLYPQEFSLYLSPFSADLLKQHYHINHLDINQTECSIYPKAIFLCKHLEITQVAMLFKNR